MDGLEKIATIQSIEDKAVDIMYHSESNLDQLLEWNAMDALITTTEGGFSPFAPGFISKHLGINKRQVLRWATVVHDAPDITLIALRSQNASSGLKGVVLAPCSRAACYENAVSPENRGTPWRDFYYNVMYEALFHATTRWKARRIAATHLAQSGEHPDETMQGCHCEALAHLVKGIREAHVESFCFLGCSCGAIPRESLIGLPQTIEEFTSDHKTIRGMKTSVADTEGEVTSISWAANPGPAVNLYIPPSKI